MKFSLISGLFLATLAMASPAPKQDKGFEVKIVYVNAPNCDVTCGANTTSSSSSSVESTTTITSTNTKYVVVTLETAYGTTSTLGCETLTTVPTDYSYAASTTTSAAPAATY